MNSGWAKDKFVYQSGGKMEELPSNVNADGRMIWEEATGKSHHGQSNGWGRDENAEILTYNFYVGTQKQYESRNLKQEFKPAH